jgi:hypothetical protein
VAATDYVEALSLPPTGDVTRAFMPTFTSTDVPAAASTSSRAMGESKDSAVPSDGERRYHHGLSHGMALIPPKLVQKILRGDFIDMHELLPDMEGGRTKRSHAAVPLGRSVVS